jgi:NAD(P)-dependent dehydrogenase (short-subunit alcohol dehydrogenase family)
MATHSSPLRNRTVVVTGAARGLGAALARAFARRGAHLALLGHETPALDAVAASLPPPTLSLGVDVTDPAALADAAAEIRRRLGPPSAVIANAGIAEGGPFATSDPADWHRVIDVNLVGSAHTARAFLPDLVATAGCFLQVASLASIGAAPMMSAYCASKAGVEAFAHTLQAEVAHEGVCVGIAYLNWLDTDMVRDADQHVVLRELRDHMPRPARRVLPTETAADRLVRGVERRRTALYVPGWLRATQPLRAALPPLVLRLARRELRGGRQSWQHTGPLGAGGRADQAVRAAR